ncbi:hypothetical protein GEV33_001127 [Tenebrio molitor]|uniref:Cytochrome P450 monooxygenase n=1 Tax=Tenebrio molitor TaxID=7067 RepID=A0A8J6LGC6_TENMO|nr:hypothetical protein GEV33_001127 [Tenebrio molitor]
MCHFRKRYLPRLVYLERVVKETLRLFPVAACLGRLLDKDIVTSNYTLPKGCECLIPIMYIHRDPNIWEHPLEFNPDRFLPEEVSKRHPYSYLPFSGGPRSCIGFKYAMMAMKTAICTVVRHYKVSTELKSLTDVDFVPGVVLKPSRGYRIGLQPPSVNVLTRVLHRRWRLEIGKMALYITFPVALFHYFNQPELFEDWVVKTKRELYPPEDTPEQRQFLTAIQKIKTQQEADRLKALEKNATN